MMPIDNNAVAHEILDRLLAFKKAGKTNITSDEIFPRKIAGEYIAAVQVLMGKGAINATPAVMRFTNMEITEIGEKLLNDTPSA